MNGLGRRGRRAVRRHHHRIPELALGAADQPAVRARLRDRRLDGDRRTQAREAGRHFDLAGALTLTIGQMVLVFGVVEGGLKGWSSFDALGPIVLGVALLALFGLIETRFASEPLIPFKELTRPLKIANNIVILFSAALFPMWFVSSLYMAQVLGISPFHVGLNFLPMTLAILLIAPRAGKLVGRFGVRAVLGSGLTMMTVGLLLFTQIKSSGSPLGVGRDPRRADDGGDRDVDRALDDRRDAGRQGGTGGPRLGPRQHLPPDRRRPRPGAADHARDPAQHRPDRPRLAGRRRAHTRLPARLPDRRLPDRARPRW